MTAPFAPKKFRSLATNRKALRDYAVIERMEAGVVLTGTEIKSVREGRITLTGGFARLEGARARLYGVHIAPYEAGNRFNPDPDRPRELLLHRKEMVRLAGLLARQGFTLVPLSAHIRGKWAKIELGLCRGRQDPDKREVIRRREADQAARRAITRSLKR